MNGDVTVTVPRGDEDLTVALEPKGHGDFRVVEAIDEFGKPVDLTDMERLRAYRLAKEGWDLTGR